MRKHPVNIAPSNRILQRIDQEITRQKRSRSEYVELHFEEVSSKGIIDNERAQRF